MEYRTLGLSNVKVTPVAFGAWAAGGWMWGGSDQKEAVKAIRRSYELGITSIDTAPVYGFGLSEEIVAEAIADIPRDKVQILTKFGLSWEGTKGEFFFHSEDNDGNPIDIYKYSSKQKVIQECENSLRRLKTDYIDLLQIHWPDASTPISETMEALLLLQKEGKILAAGVCNYNVEQMKEAEKVIELASNQVPYSMVHRKIESDVVPFCLENNKSVLAYSPLQRGLLTGKITPDYQFSKGDTRIASSYYHKENVIRINEMLEKLKPLAADKGATLSQLVIQWTINQPGITCALVGARNPKQAEENAKALDISLSKEDIQFINQQLQVLELIA